MYFKCKANAAGEVPCEHLQLINNSRGEKCKPIMIKIDLNFFVNLSRFLPSEKNAFQIPVGTTVDMLMKDLGIPDNSVKLM